VCGFTSEECNESAFKRKSHSACYDCHFIVKVKILSII
jgi:hypothetical protein